MSDDIDAQLAALEAAAPEADDELPAEIAQPEAEPAPEAKTEEAPKPEEQQGEPRHVPYGALKEERQKRRELERAVKAMEDTFKAFQERTAAEIARARQPAQPQDQYQDDPVNVLIDDYNRRLAYQQDQARLTQQQREQQQVIQSIQSRHAEYEADFVEEHPDYYDAAQFLMEHQAGVFDAFGYAPQERDQMLNTWSLQIVDAAIRAGRDPAKAVYDAAKKAGFSKPAPQQTQQPAQPQQRAAEALAMRAAGEAEARTLSGGGSAGSGEMSLKAIAQLKGAAFDAAMEKFLQGAR